MRTESMWRIGVPVLCAAIAGGLIALAVGSNHQESTRVGTFANGKVVPVLRATNDGGQHWETRSLPGGGNMVAGLDFVSESQGWVLVEDPREPTMLYATTDGGRTWATSAAGGRLAGVDV